MSPYRYTKKELVLRTSIANYYLKHMIDRWYELT